MDDQHPQSKEPAGAGSVSRLVRIIWLAFFYLVWTPVIYILWIPVLLAGMGTALLATLLYPGKWENGTWTRVYPNKGGKSLVRLFRRLRPAFCSRCGGKLVTKYAGFGMQCVCCEECLHIPSQSYVDRHAKHMPPALPCHHD